MNTNEQKKYLVVDLDNSLLKIDLFKEVFGKSLLTQPLAFIKTLLLLFKSKALAKTYISNIEYKSLILLLLFFSLTAKSNFIHVLFDLPQAYKHNLEVLDRYEFIVNQEQKRESIVYMEPYQYRPTIPLGGVPQMLNTNTKHPWNRPLANFFNVDSIKVSKDLHWLYGPHPYYGYSQHPYPVRILHHNLYRLHYFLVAPFKLIFG